MKNDPKLHVNDRLSPDHGKVNISRVGENWAQLSSLSFWKTRICWSFRKMYGFKIYLFAFLSDSLSRSLPKTKDLSKFSFTFSIYAFMIAQ